MHTNSSSFAVIPAEKIAINCFLMQYHKDVNIKKRTRFGSNDNLGEETAVDTSNGF